MMLDETISDHIHIFQVVVPKVSIIGPKEIFVDVGSQAVVECVMENVINVPEFVLWSFNGKVVSTKYKLTAIIQTKDKICQN